MLSDIHIAVIGAGAMGGAIIGGLLQKGLVDPGQITAADPREERCRELRAAYGIHVTTDNQEAAQRGQIIVFGIKPQMAAQVLPPLQGMLHENSLCISILAGTPISMFHETLHHMAVVRCMPNTPAQIGEGMLVWTAAPAVSDQQRDQARAILGALGRERYVENEGYLDMATAINGSGPAYVFLMLEAMIDAGVHMGFARPVAEELVLQTVLGSVRYAQHSGQHPAQLRNAVTSPAGTTAAGLSELERGSLRTTMSNAIWAAYRRSQELGGKRET
jgi:pyrroline-5-carboxylate reductase